jgi:hypothetical protein
MGEPAIFGIHPEDVGVFVERLGFAVSDIGTADELERRYVKDERKVYPAMYTLHIAVPG